jgi:hypothetical protein
LARGIQGRRNGFTEVPVVPEEDLNAIQALQNLRSRFVEAEEEGNITSSSSGPSMSGFPPFGARPFDDSSP